MKVKVNPRCADVESDGVLDERFMLRVSIDEDRQERGNTLVAAPVWLFDWGDGSRFALEREPLLEKTICASPWTSFCAKRRNGNRPRRGIFHWADG